MTQHASTTLALFGATGRTGKRVLVKALAAGYRVRVLVRDPARLDVESDRLEVVTGDVTDPKAVAETVAGSQAVLSLFGHVKGSPKTLQSDGTRAIVEAMKAHGVSRIVTLSGGGLRAPGDKPKAPDTIIRFLLKTMAAHVLADAESHLDELTRSGLDWTVVRAPRLTEKPGTGSFRVGLVGGTSGIQISRDDLADFILTQVDDRTFLHQLPFVSA